MAALYLASCGSPEGREPIAASVEPSKPVQTTTTFLNVTTTTVLREVPTLGRSGPIAENAPGLNTRLIDDSLEPWPSSPLVNTQSFSTIEELAAASDVVFVGVLTRASSAVRTLDLGGPPDSQSTFPPIQFDGLHFRVTQVFKGRAKPGDELTIAVPSIVEVDDGSGVRLMRVVSETADLFQHGLRNAPATQQYLIFATSREGWEPVLELLSPEGLSEVSPDGRLSVPSNRGPLLSSVSDLNDVSLRLGS